VASFLWGHSEKESVLPALGIVEATHASQLPVNARREIIAALCLSHAPPCLE
jgi:hypothetical protein